MYKTLQSKYIKKINSIEKLLMNMNGGNNQYIQFASIQGKNLKDDFISDLNEYAKFDTVSQNLLEVLKNKHMTVSFHFCDEINMQGCYLVIIHCHLDSILIDFGKKFDLPRGFPIIWSPKKFCNMYGFYPKFENDEIDDDNTSDQTQHEDFIGASSLDFNFKYSGFLGQIIAFEYNNNIYWTSCAKNSTNNDFSHDIKRIISPKMSQELLNKMVSDKIHFCGETMSYRDQKHGSCVLQEALVTTAVGYGHWLNYEQQQIKSTNNINKFVKFFDQRTMHTFCMAFNLDIDGIYNISTTAENNIITEFLIELAKQRNYINMESFYEFWTNFRIRYSNLATVEKGNIVHEQILGNVLEGLIIKISYFDETKARKTIKYKFPFYTIRTMFIRSFLEKNGTLLVPKLYFDEGERFVKRWVVNDLYGGKLYWKYVLVLLYNSYKKFDELYSIYANQKETNLCDKHIFIIDQLSKLPEFAFDASKQYGQMYEVEKNKILTETQYESILNMVLTLGPIGGGKSTISEMICKCGQGLVHIDGDKLDLTEADVSKLSEERNPYTIYKVIEQFMKNNIPVLSQGGGILLDNKTNDVSFFNDLMKTFKNKIKIEVTLLLPSDGDKIYELDSKSTLEYVSEAKHLLATNDDTNLTNINLKFMQALYKNKQRLDTVIAQRGWDKSATGKIMQRNVGNFSIALKILISLFDNKLLKKLILYPTLGQSNYVTVKSQLEQNLQTVCPIVKLETKNVSIPYFTQKRMLCKYIINGEFNYHHITLHYDKNKNIQLNQENYLDDQKYLKQPTKGFLHRIPNKTELNNIEKLLINCKALNQLLIDRNIQYDKLNELVALINITNPFEVASYVLNNKDNFKNLLGSLRATVMKNKIQGFENAFAFECLNKEDWYISFITFDKNVNLPNGANAFAHITVNAGKHEPAKMKDASLNYNSGNAQFEIEEKMPPRNKVTYMFQNNGFIAPVQTIDVEFVNVFYL